MSRQWRGAPEEEAVRGLLQAAGPRPALPREDVEAIREAARDRWRGLYGAGAPARRSRRPWFAAAAVLVAGIIGLVWVLRSRPHAIEEPVASIERSGGGASSMVGSRLAAGSVLETGRDDSGRLALRMQGGASVRLDAATRVRLASATLIDLGRGAVYVDSGDASSRAQEVSVRAPQGVFRPEGTQFEVRADAGETRLRVREGSVRLDRGRESVTARSGEELVVRADGSLDRRVVAVAGPDWDWVGATAPMLDIEGVRLRDFLKWIGRETGRRIEIADGEAAAAVDSCVLHGSIAQLTLADAPAVVLSSCGLRQKVSGGTLSVFVARD